MTDLLLWAPMAVVCGGLGWPLARILPARFEWRSLLAPTLGSGVLAVLVPLAYRFGVPLRIQLAIWATLAIVLLAVRLRRERPRVPRAIAGACIAASLVLLAPRWVGGDQFAVFQGNQWDTFAYVDASLAYATKSYKTIHNSGEWQQLRNPFFANAQGQLAQRPAVDELYAMFTRVEPGQAYRLYYGFLVFFMAQLVLVGLFVVRSVLPRAPPGTVIAISLAFPLGFWGQYVVDINAWSQVASAPLLFAIFGLALHAPATTERRDAWRLGAAIAIAVAGASYLYPEGLFIYSAAIVPVALVAGAVATWRAKRLELARAIPLAGFAGVASVALDPALARFLTSQITNSAGHIVPWWQFFQRFFIGRDDTWGDGFARVADFVASLFGCYFATPAGDGVLAVVARVGVLVGLLGLIVALVRMAREPLVAAWVATGVLLLAPAAYLALHANYWVAGKVVSYAAPVFVGALCLPLARSDRWRWFAGVYVALQLGSAVLRIPAATWDDHIGYARPYPAIQNPGLKHDLGWDLRGLEPLLDRHSKVTLYPSEPWSENAMMAFLTARGIPYVKQGPVTAMPGGPPLGKMPMPWTPNVEISIERDAFVLNYLDGRPHVRVPSR